ncbi:Chromosome partitioning protein ParA [compost metagenome]
MAVKIAFFNHKGGVSKTTTTFNVGWMLAEKGYKVILVDADPQCNLSGMILGYNEALELEDFYNNGTINNIRDGLKPAFESMPRLLEAVECTEVEGRPNLLLLPGHIKFAEYDVTLGISQELSGSIQALKNLPGSIAYLLDRTAERYSADYILIDMSPSLSSINQNLMMISNYFIVPTSPDFYSVMAIDSLTSIFKRWHAWSNKAQNVDILKSADYPFPNVLPKFMGSIIQKYRLRDSRASQGFQYWIDRINLTVKDKLITQLKDIDMMLPEEAYINNRLTENYCLGTIPDFNTLIARSQQHKTPVFALTNEQLGHRGVVGTSARENRDRFYNIFNQLTNNIIGMVEYAERY